MNTDMFKRLFLNSDIKVSQSMPEISGNKIRKADFTPEMRSLLLLNQENEESSSSTDESGHEFDSNSESESE